MSDEAADREHPAAEKLSAYQANELSPEEDDAIQEHVATCGLCAERVLDLQRFLEYAPEEPSREGVTDLETAAEWRKLRRKVQFPRAGLLARFMRSPGLPVAAVLAVALIWTSYRVVVLNRELTEPITDLRTTTIEASGSRKGEPAGAEPISLRLGRAVAFETLADHPHRRYRLIFRDERGQIQKTVEDTEDDDGMITLFLPKRFLAPGLYDVEVVGIDGSRTRPIRSFEIRILP